jgi:hypothetical protein
MPRPISWLPRLEAIRRSVSHSKRSYYERKDIELLFKLQTAAAGKLMAVLPTVPVGTALVVERDVLDLFLKQMARAGDVHALLKQMREERGARSRRKLRRFTRRDLEPTGLRTMPDWIKLTRGHAEFDFASADLLAEGMLIVLVNMVEEFEAFVAAYEPVSPAKVEDRKAADEMGELWRELEERMAARAS